MSATVKRTVKKKSKLFSRTLWTVVTSLCALLLAVFIVGTFIAVNFASAAINMVFGVDPTRVVGETENMRFESDWADVNGKGLFIEDKIMIRKAAAEGMTLLWNKPIEDGSDALPLPEGSWVSTLSHSAVDIAECGGGSGAIDDNNTLPKEGRVTTLRDALNWYYAVTTNFGVSMRAVRGRRIRGGRIVPGPMKIRRGMSTKCPGASIRPTASPTLLPNTATPPSLSFRASAAKTAICTKVRKFPSNRAAILP